MAASGPGFTSQGNKYEFNKDNRKITLNKSHESINIENSRIQNLETLENLETLFNKNKESL